MRNTLAHKLQWSSPTVHSSTVGQTLDCFSKGIEFTQSHRSEKAFPDSHDKCEPVNARHYIISASQSHFLANKSAGLVLGCSRADKKWAPRCIAE